MIRSVLVVYLPILLLSTLAYHSQTSSSNSRTVSIIRPVRTVISVMEKLSLALYSVVTPNENKPIHDSAVYYLVFFHTLNTIITTLLVYTSVPSSRFKKVSVALKLCLILMSLFLRSVSLPSLCSTTSPDCILHHVFFMPLFAVFHGSAVLDIGDRSVVVRNTSVKKYERNVLQAKHERIQRGRVPDVETVEF